VGTGTGTDTGTGTGTPEVGGLQADGASSEGMLASPERVAFPANL